MASTTYAEYLVALPSGLAIPKNTYNAGLKVLWGNKVRGMSANNINANTIADIRYGYGAAGTLVEKERAYLISLGAPAGTVADMRMYCVLNVLLP